MLVVCSDIRVLRSPLMGAEATRMQDLASEFSKKFPGVPHSGRGRPLPAPTPSSASGRAQAPRCWDPNLGPLTFQPWLRPWHRPLAVGSDRPPRNMLLLHMLSCRIWSFYGSNGTSVIKEDTPENLTSSPAFQGHSRSPENAPIDPTPTTSY